MDKPLEIRFHDTMVGVYRRARSEAGYNAHRFILMLGERGGLETARHLLHAPAVSEGYTALWERGRLDLTVERVILEPAWRSLFTSDERRIAIARLRDYGYTGPLPQADEE